MGEKTDKKNNSKCRGGDVEFNAMHVFCDLLLLLLLLLLLRSTAAAIVAAALLFF